MEKISDTGIRNLAFKFGCFTSSLWCGWGSLRVKFPWLTRVRPSGGPGGGLMHSHVSWWASRTGSCWPSMPRTGGILLPHRAGLGLGRRGHTRVMARRAQNRNLSPPPPPRPPLQIHQRLAPGTTFQPYVSAGWLISTLCTHLPPSSLKGASLGLPLGELPRFSPPENGAEEKLQAGGRDFESSLGAEEGVYPGRKDPVPPRPPPGSCPTLPATHRPSPQILVLREKLEIGILM